MTTQSPHLYARQSQGAPADPAGRTPGSVQTRLPWWAVALPAVAFAALLLLITGGGAGAAGAAPAGDLLSRAVAALSGLLGHLL
ncbi:hypothetical protein [Actinacidiphila epipremni]|uniref:Uncharacterized protein n=1 Tax=Actinacidiphila epipremni TaxID=2053013 RepID=A0ABX0ZNV8_9ACTN|nr:hypothetical protein [Actinacidiphila epipremni]NJP45574.1 hypothetical protein [Actinacidiphila epipremni]